MDEKIETAVRDHIAREEGQWEEIHRKLDKAQQAIDSLRVDLRDTRAEAERQRGLVEPFAEFLADMRTVGRVGRGLRAFIGYVALLLGAGALMWVAVIGAVGKD